MDADGGLGPGAPEVLRVGAGCAVRAGAGAGVPAAVRVQEAAVPGAVLLPQPGRGRAADRPVAHLGVAAEPLVVVAEEAGEVGAGGVQREHLVRLVRAGGGGPQVAVDVVVPGVGAVLHRAVAPEAVVVELAALVPVARHAAPERVVGAQLRVLRVHVRAQAARHRPDVVEVRVAPVVYRHTLLE